MTDLTERSVPDQTKLVHHMPPVFDSLDAERRHRKERLAGALRIFGRLGFSEGVAGHITARDPELLDHFWVNPFGMNFRHIKASDLILVNHDGQVVEGSRPVNRAAFVIHAAVHAARPDVIAAAHAHSIYGKSFSSLGRTLDPITQDACVFFEDHALVTEGGGRIVLDEAAWWFITMERTCQAQLLAEAAGTPLLVNADDARYTRDQSGFPLAGWFSFQPLWDDIVRTDPELFD